MRILYGEWGTDTLYPRDGEVDRALDCGSERDSIYKDPSDPPAQVAR